MRRMLATGILLVFLAASVSDTEVQAESNLIAPKKMLGYASAVISVFEDGIPSPAGLALTGDGDLLVVTREDASFVYKIDLEDGRNKGFSLFASDRNFCNSRYVAIDSNGFVYIDTSRPSTLSHTRSDGYTRKIIRYVGMFQISPDGKTVKRIEDIDDDTFGLAVDPNGNLFACNAEVPIDQQDTTVKVVEKTFERMFESTSARKPYITKFKLGGDSALDSRSSVARKMEVTPSGITFDSEGNLFFVAGGTVSKVTFGIFGASKPKTFATLPTANAKATRSLGINADNSDNLYVSVTNPYKPNSGIIFKINPKGEVTTFAKGLISPTDCIADSKGNIYISDPKAGKVYQISAEALHLPGPFRIKKPPPPAVAPPVEPVATDKPKGPSPPVVAPPIEPVATDKPKESSPPVVEPELNITQMTYMELSEMLVSIDKKLGEKQALAYPDTIVLKGGKEMKCEIVSDTEDSVSARMSRGRASIMRSRIETVIYATEDEKDKALQAESEAEELQEQKSLIQFRMRELKPRVKRKTRTVEYEYDDDYDD